MLPEARPAIVSQQILDDKDCYKRFILFNPTVSGSQSYHRPTPPGLWSRLLSRIMNNIKEVSDILSEQVPFEDVSLSSIPIKDRNSLVEVPKQQFFIKGNGILVYWLTGIFYNYNGLFFIVESFVGSGEHKNKNGIIIMCSPTTEGRKVFGQLIDLVEQLISEWYPGLELDHKIPCHKCIREGWSPAYEFEVDQLLPPSSDHTECGFYHKVQLIDLAPDLFLADFDPVFLLDCNKLIYRKEKETLLGTGRFEEVYCGKYKDQSVAVKLYIENQLKEAFKELRSESIILQQLHHPCVVHMVGVTVYPTMSLVLVEASQGTLQASLLKEQRTFSRIVMYRIAIQVASALHYLHSINIIFRDLKADNVLLWSLSPDHLLNCKIINFKYLLILTLVDHEVFLVAKVSLLLKLLMSIV
ncbi:leucine-rich repeat serine/threonine-protein kinase 1-like [Dysidea avara]|uniref:leucine-rich repeat serine/threonine-protein kinase 1-like n=1 Tax=Dysidea avara TaxID=196820 RepID=UPI003324F45E